MQQIAVVDLGVGNLRSVEHATRAVAGDAKVVVTGNPAIVEASDKVILPGQGAVGTWFRSLRERNLVAAIQDAIQHKPMLGICVGMQALYDFCEEDGGMDGLGLFTGSVRHFRHFHKEQNRLKIPQMGWNQVKQNAEHPIWYNIANNSHFYFVHSYCANCDSSSSQVAATADYGHEFIAAATQDNVFAVQFHPEKSHTDGLQLIRNFTQWQGH